MAKSKRKLSRRPNGYSIRSKAPPYEDTLQDLLQDQFYIKKIGKSIPSKFKEAYLLEYLQRSPGLRYLHTSGFSGEAVVDYLTWFCSKLAIPTIMERRSLEKATQPDPYETFKSDMEQTLRKLVRLFRHESARRFFSEGFFKEKFGQTSTQSIGIFSLLSLLCAKLEEKYKPIDQLIEAFENAPPSQLDIATKSNKRTDDDWRPLLIVAAIECETRFGEYMPTFLRDLFNTPRIRNHFPNMPELSKDQIVKIIQRKAKARVIPGLKIKKNPANKGNLGVDTFYDA